MWAKKNNIDVGPSVEERKRFSYIEKTLNQGKFI